ncbi:unnamed protein product [Spirodela intermedia]|uniref:Uncharacterized protein n=1 Tax=Spirodela intermedia TaxID=51605 RepID=A0ABN7E956_SPIIN|nr:unnamed protein product [Spirodela intermedia]
MRWRCTGILSVWEDRRVVSTASKALLGQRRRGQSLDLLSKFRDQWNGSSSRLWRLSPGRAEKRRLCGSPVAVTRRREAGWRWGVCKVIIFPLCQIIWHINQSYQITQLFI